MSTTPDQDPTPATAEADTEAPNVAPEDDLASQVDAEATPDDRSMDPGEGPWDRQDGEGDEAWEAFEVYRDMGHTRSYRATAEHIGKSRQMMEKWGRRWSWPLRATAYDNALARRSAVEQREARATALKRQEAVGSTLMARGLRALAQIKIETLKPMEVLRMIELGSRIQREAFGISAHARLDVVHTAAGYQTSAPEAADSLTAEETHLRLQQVAGEAARRIAESGKRVPAALLAYLPEEDDIEDAVVVEEEVPA